MKKNICIGYLKPGFKFGNYFMGLQHPPQPPLSFCSQDTSISPSEHPHSDTLLGPVLHIHAPSQNALSLQSWDMPPSLLLHLGLIELHTGESLYPPLVHFHFWRKEVSRLVVLVAVQPLPHVSLVDPQVQLGSVLAFSQTSYLEEPQADTIS